MAERDEEAEEEESSSSSSSSSKKKKKKKGRRSKRRGKSRRRSSSSRRCTPKSTRSSCVEEVPDDIPQDPMSVIINDVVDLVSVPEGKYTHCIATSISDWMSPRLLIPHCSGSASPPSSCPQCVRIS